MHYPPLVNGTGGTHGNAIHTKIAFSSIDNDVVVIVGDRFNRTCIFTGMAADTYFRIYKMLLDRLSHNFNLQFKQCEMLTTTVQAQAMCN